MKNIFMKRFIKTAGLLMLAVIVVIFAAWFTAYLFNNVPVCMQIGEVFGISGLSPEDWSSGFLACALLVCICKIYTSIIKAIVSL